MNGFLRSWFILSSWIGCQAGGSLTILTIAPTLDSQGLACLAGLAVSWTKVMARPVFFASSGHREVFPLSSPKAGQQIADNKLPTKALWFSAAVRDDRG